MSRPPPVAPPTFLGLTPELLPERVAATVLPVPFDGTSTWRKGADRGPAALLEASTAVELYDIETASEPWRRGIRTLQALDCPLDPRALVEHVEAAVGAVLDAGELPVVIGGEHSVSIGAIYASAQRYPDLTVLQVDAHADTRETYEGSTFNHACVMARARERCPIVQVGVRSVDASEVAGLDRERVFWAHEMGREPTAAWVADVAALLTPHVYVTIDLDAFDPSLIPATGTPEPGGLSWYQVTDLLRRVARASRVVGFDVVELLPSPGEHASAFAAAPPFELLPA